jgi:hypothetical protein
MVLNVLREGGSRSLALVVGCEVDPCGAQVFTGAFE